MSADYTPNMGEYTDLRPFRFWCQKVMPLVYDDSLSYYELLCKVVDYLNKAMEDTETLHVDVTNLHSAYVKLQEYVNGYFTNLDLQEEINNKLDNMAENGELYEIIKRYTDPIVNEQNDKINVLKSRMDTFSSLPSGSTSGDAELTDIRVGYDGYVYPSAGDAVRGQITTLNETLVKGFGEEIYFTWSWVEGEYVTTSGKFEAYNNWHRSDYVALNGYRGKIKFTNNGNKHEIYNCFYTKNKTLITSFYNDAEIDVPDGAEYFAVSISSKYTIKAEKKIVPLVEKVDKSELALASKYGSLVDNEHQNLITEYHTANASLSGNVLTFNNANGVLLTNKFFSNSANCRLKVDLDTTTPIFIYLSYFDSNGSEKFKKLFESTEQMTKITDTFEFDCASYIVYNDAKEFRIRLQCSKAGIVTLNEFEVYNPDEMELSKLYSKEFKPMMNNVFVAVETLQKGGDKTETVVLKNGNAEKYDLQIDNNGNLYTVPHIPNKVLFLGNSLVFGMNNTDDRSQSFGMCATDYTKDYRYHVEQAILSKNSSATFTRLYSSPFEHSETLQTAQAFITENETMFDPELNLVIVQMSENVNTDDKRNVFKQSFPKLIHTIRTRCPKAKVVCVGGWFSESIATQVMSDTSFNYGCTYISIRDLFKSENLGTTGATVTYKNGETGTVLEAWRTHPGNTGMKAIADKIIETLDM